MIFISDSYDYFVAGIGDTLAKWYEMEGIIRQVPQEELSASVRLGLSVPKKFLKYYLQIQRRLWRI